MIKELERALQYRQQAVELLLIAERVATEEQRRTLFGLVAAYHRVAEQLQEMPNAESKD